MSEYTITVTVIPGEIARTLILLFLATLIYDRLFVDHVVREMDGRHGVTAWLVVFGVGIVILFFGMSLGVPMAILLTSFFIAAGLPMIVGSKGRSVHVKE